MPSPRRARRGLHWSASRLVALLAVAVLSGVVVAGMILPFVGPVAVMARDSISSFEDLPQDFREPQLPVRTRVYAADGTKIATLYEENRKEVPLDKIAPVMQEAVIAIEDSRFYEHNGFDPRGFMRAAVTNVTAGGVTQGGSTLTMQYVKNVLLTAARDEEEQAAAREDTITRKLREIRYAMSLEKRLTKEEILNRYLNISYYGARAYGVEAASQRYFSKKAKNLELVEAATLAGIVQQPSRFDPTRNPRQSQARRDVVLNRMAELGYITVDEAREAKALDVEDYLDPKIQYNGCTSSIAPYYCDYAIREVQGLKALGKKAKQRQEAWRSGGYKVYTTLDLKAQKAADKAVKAAIPPKDPSRKATAIAMITPGTGDIRAMAQNRVWGTNTGKKDKYWQTTYNYAVDLADGGTQGMQAGSTFKIFTTVAALEKGISPFTVIPSPPSKVFTGMRGCNGNLLIDGGIKPYTVGNSTSSGNYDMFRGAAYSVNTFFVELEKRAGVCETVNAAQKLGVRYADGGRSRRHPAQRCVRRGGLLHAGLDRDLPADTGERLRHRLRARCVLQATFRHQAGRPRWQVAAGAWLQVQAGDHPQRRRRCRSRPDQRGRRDDPRSHWRRDEPRAGHHRQDRHDRRTGRRLVRGIHPRPRRSRVGG